MGSLTNMRVNVFEMCSTNTKKKKMVYLKHYFQKKKRIINFCLVLHIFILLKLIKFNSLSGFIVYYFKKVLIIFWLNVTYLIKLFFSFFFSNHGLLIFFIGYFHLFIILIIKNLFVCYCRLRTPNLIQIF